MKNEFRNLMNSVKRKIDPQRRHHGFEVLGFDFMLDEDLKLYLIEVNDNPALNTQKCKVLEDCIFAFGIDVNNLTINTLWFDYNDPDQKNRSDYITNAVVSDGACGNGNSNKAGIDRDERDRNKDKDVNGKDISNLILNLKKNDYDDNNTNYNSELNYRGFGT